MPRATARAFMCMKNWCPRCGVGCVGPACVLCVCAGLRGASLVCVCYIYMCMWGLLGCVVLDPDGNPCAATVSMLTRR